jgi:hypothetical protein
MRIEMDLNEAESKKLTALAEARRRTPEQCLRDFIAACQPGGTGWEHPSKAKALSSSALTASTAPPEEPAPPSREKP